MAAKNRKFRRGDVVQVDWGDAFSTAGWRSTDSDDCTPHPVTCIGSFVVQNSKGIIITIGFAKDGQNLGQMFIPTGMIFQTKLLIPTSKIKVNYK